MKARSEHVISGALALALAATAAAQATQPPRYASAMQYELQSMGLRPSCTNEPQARFHCTCTGQASTAARQRIIHAVYSDESDTVYFYIEGFLSLPPDGPKAPAVLRRLMELNWELLIGKLEWSPRTGEVRLSAVLNTDSNFDRRAFRSIVRALDTVATRYERELRSLATP
jgi:hypothetical protein